MEFLDLEPEDAPRRGRPRGAVATIRVRHHRIAALVARGLSDAEVARLVECSPPTVRNYRLNPANQQLIAELTEVVDEEILDHNTYSQKLMRRARILSQELLVEALEAASEGGEPISVTKLLAIQADMGDRTGHPKTQVNVGLNLNAGDKLARARARVKELNSKEVIEGVVQGNVVKLRRF